MIENSHSQDAPFTIKGHWWLPGTDQRVAGDLVYDEKNLTLELYGGLNAARVISLFGAAPEESSFLVVHGESLDRTPLTLLNSFYTKWKPDIRSLVVQPGAHTQLLSSTLCGNGMVIGVHLTSLDHRFSKCRVEVPDLETWLGNSPFDKATSVL